MYITISGYNSYVLKQQNFFEKSKRASYNIACLNHARDRHAPNKSYNVFPPSWLSMPIVTVIALALADPCSTWMRQ